jgi:glycosyltransferase involved in cell wall biosynthesis
MTATLGTEVGSRQTAAAWLRSRCRGPLRAGAVLLHAPSFAFQAPGGGENQLVQTGMHLEALGQSVRPFCPWTDRLKHARLLHLFGMSREGLELARRARALGTPVVLSPISWFEPSALWALEKGPARKIAGLAARGARRIAPGLPGWRRELLSLADRILPNSHAEANQLVSLFAADPEKIRVVPNGVLDRFRSASPEPFRERLGTDEDFVLFVGRIEPRKNPLGLIRAMRRLGGVHPRLVIIGDAPPESRGYLERCRAEGGDAVRWLPAIDHHDPLLASAYAAARVFALPSWFETPGLAALEAALAGVPIVITPFGSTSEYFGGRVAYARPGKVGEIADAIRAQWSRGRDPRLASFVASHYLWPRVAQETAEAYEQIAA